MGGEVTRAAFFSPRNVESINRAMIAGVYRVSGRRIGRQSQDELANIMRSVFDTHATRADLDVEREVAELNSVVLEFCVDRIVSEANMHDHFMRDRESGWRGAIPNSEMTSTAGRRAEVPARSRDWVAPGLG